MILSDSDIKEALQAGQITIDPPPLPDHYQPSAVDILLGDSFRVWDLELLTNTPGFQGVLDLSQQKFLSTAAKFAKDAKRQDDGSVILPPYHAVQQVMLCQTQATITLHPESQLAARVEGRSSLARLGVMVHLTAPTIHAAFSGKIALEMINHGPFYLRLVPHKTVICQFIFECVKSKPGMKITTQFQGQTTPTGEKT